MLVVDGGGATGTSGDRARRFTEPADWSSAGGGARPRITDRGCDDNPMRWLLSWLTDHVNAAVTAMPSNAPAAHSTPRRVIFIAAAP